MHASASSAAGTPHPMSTGWGTERPSEPGADAMIVSAEELLVSTAWTVSGRVRLRRRIITETRMVEVVVRREVVEIDGDAVDFRNGRLVGTDVDGAPVPPPAHTSPFVMTLREEVPEINLRVRDYERVTLTVSRTTDTSTVHDTVRREQTELGIEDFGDASPLR